MRVRFSLALGWLFILGLAWFPAPLQGQDLRVRERPIVRSPGPAPVNLRATVLGAAGVELAWDGAPGATGYLVYRAGTDGVYAALTTTPIEATVYLDRGAAAGSELRYKVAALHVTLGPGESEPLVVVTPSLAELRAGAQRLPVGERVGPVPLGPAPTGLNATAAGPTAVRLSWTAPPGASGFFVLRARPNGPWTRLVSTPLTTPTYMDASVAPNLDLIYRVVALYPDGREGGADATVRTPDGHPSGFSARQTAPGTIELTWTPLANAKKHWIAGDGAPGSGVSPQPDRYTIRGLPPGTYRYTLVTTFEVAGIGEVEAHLPTAPRTAVTVGARVWAARRPSDVFFAGDNSKDPASIIRRDIILAGWLIGDPWFNPGPDGRGEDYHYEILLDVDFINEHYGGAGSRLAGAVLPGNPANPQRTLPFVDMTPNGTARGVTVNSFLLPGGILTGEGTPLLWGELNAWRRSLRGTPPAGWVPDPSGNADIYWPFHPRDPYGTGELKAGDYVIMRGALWQDAAHVEGWFCRTFGGVFCSPTEKQPDKPARDCWDRGSIPPDPANGWPQTRWMEGQSGWLEIHPVDEIYRSQPRSATVAAPGALERPRAQDVSEPRVAHRSDRTVRTVLLCVPVEMLDVSRTMDMKLGHTMPKPSPNHVLRFSELIDGRFTDMRNVDEQWARVIGDSLVVHVKAHSSGTASLQAREGRFKASYILWWEQPGVVGSR